MIAFTLMVISVPVLADPSECPCFTAEQVAGTCLQYLDQDSTPGVRYRWHLSTDYPTIECGNYNNQWEYRAFAAHSSDTVHCLSDHSASHARNYRRAENSWGNNTQYDLTDPELIACQDELADAAELLGVDFLEF